MQLPKPGAEGLLGAKMLPVLRQRSGQSLLILMLLCASIFVLNRLSTAPPLPAIAEGVPLPTPTVEKKNCACTNLKIASNLETVKAGETVEFSIESDDAGLLSGTFEWTVSAGEIISGQGTSKIIVKTTEDMLKLGPAPAPSSSDLHGIVIGFSGRRRPQFVVSVIKVSDKPCGCPPATRRTIVGHQSVKWDEPANVESLALDKTHVVLHCKPGQIPQTGTEAPDPIIDVSPVAKDPEGDVLTYQYTVSGGKIVGTGAKVQWDLSDVSPGTYMITAGVDDGCGICGKTMTKEVTAKACTPTCGLVNCPTLELSGPVGTEKLDEYNVVASISGGSQDQVITFQWSVTNGEIVAGQGTPSVRVKPLSNSNGKHPVVTLKVGGFDPEGACPDEASITLP